MKANDKFDMITEAQNGGVTAFIAAAEAAEEKDECNVIPDIAAQCEECGADAIAVEESASDEEINKHKLGKFRNPQELLRAYGELEKEFTRRSQRLKELENGMSRKQPKSDEEWKSEVDKFFSEIPTARAFAKDIANQLLANPQLRQEDNCLKSALLNVLADKFRTPEQLMEDGQFLNDYVLRSDKVRDAVISRYLSDVRTGLPPHTMSNGGLQCVAPGVKPKTIEEAGFMFLKNNK